MQGSACGGYRVLDSDLGTFHAAYRALGGKAVLGRPLCSVWASGGPALQAFDTMVLGAVPNAAGKRPSVRPVDWRRAGERFGRPLGVPSVLPDGAVRQPFERVVIELPPDGGPARLVPLGQLAVRVGLVPERARRLEPVPGLPALAPPTAVDPGPFLRLLAGSLGLLALAAAGAAAVGRARAGRPVPPPGD